MRRLHVSVAVAAWVVGVLTRTGSQNSWQGILVGWFSRGLMWWSGVDFPSPGVGKTAHDGGYGSRASCPTGIREMVEC
ncbi:hypothetical protein EI94DRAFT_279988 [Lactarius quietus]|nr:hypothetical protein EI94DRAFT_279988 [Lactarius quietus]